MKYWYLLFGIVYCMLVSLFIFATRYVEINNFCQTSAKLNAKQNTHIHGLMNQLPRRSPPFSEPHAAYSTHS